MSETSDTVKTNRCPARAQMRFFNIPCSKSILHTQLGARLHAEVLHDRVFVKGHGSRAYLEEVRDFLHRVAFREELQHFALPCGKLLRDRLGGPAEEDTQRHALGDERGDVGLARERPLYGGESSRDAEFFSK